MKDETTKNVQWGGQRKNAGRKRKYGEKTKVLTIRVPFSKVDEIKGIIQYILDEKTTEEPYN
jgi:hypothetical protein